MKLHAVISGVLAAAGFIAFLATRGGIDPENFWHPYVLATSRVGVLLMAFGAIWLVLSLAHLYSHFFDLDRPADSGEFTVGLVATLILMGILFVTIMPRLPTTAPSQLPPDPKAREQILRTESNFTRLVGFMILASGIGLVSIPFRRFMRS